MRISELLLEASPPPGPAPAGMTWNGTMWVPASTPAPAPSSPAPSSPSGPDPKKRAERKQRVERGRRVQRGKNYLVDLIQNRRNEPAYNALGRSNALKRIGGAMRILRLIGYADLAIGYWTDIAIVEEELARQVAAKEITKEEANEDYNETRKQLLAVIVTTIAASSFIKYALRTAMGLRWLVRALGLAETVVSGGLGIGLLIASEIAMTYFMNWATSDEGKKTIAEIITYPIIGDIKASDAIGALATAPIDKVKSLIAKFTGEAKKDDQKPGDPAKPGQGTQPSDGKWKPEGPKEPPKPGQPGYYSAQTNDPELRKALQAAGL